ncbi:MAG: hypothetical protein Rubg2KO_18620 [Rubricoccaceae bacterium]
MTRFIFVALLLVAATVGGCAEPAEAPGVEELEDPVIEDATGLTTTVEEPEHTDGFDFRVEGETGPSASYALDEGAECLAYAAHIVRLTPVEDGDGDTIEIVARPEGASPLDVCSAEGDVDLPTRAGVDSFVALDGPVLWTLSDASGRDLLKGFDFEAGEDVFEETVTPPVVRDADGLVYGGPPEAMADMEALAAAGVTCPEAEAWFADGHAVAISRRLRFSFESSETADAGEALCLILDDA